MKIDFDPRDPVQRAAALVELFCSLNDFGGLRSVASNDVPEPARTLLDHRSHMTVAMERFHRGDVRLRVVSQAGGTGTQSPHSGWYAREILLETQAGTIVQHGIVRIDLSHLDPAAAAAIREARRPLGRILIDAGMLREVHGVRLLEIVPGPHLQTMFAGLADPRADPIEAARPVYGRVADIQLDGLPTVELLEIVAPFAKSLG